VEQSKKRENEEGEGAKNGRQKIWDKRWERGFGRFAGQFAVKGSKVIWEY
jgi:hypothetical protein